MRICVIFNPAAKGDKARHFRAHLDEIAAKSSLKMTTAAGDARRLAAEAVREGFDTIVAAGGDGTVNEVLNGLGDAQGFEKARLGVLPLGTVNVFARELKLPLKLQQAWELILKDNETTIDLPSAEFQAGGRVEHRFFAQLAGAGLDARAVELVDWSLKKKLGPLAYVWAGLKAMTSAPCDFEVRADGRSFKCQLALVGNGRLYGGNYRLFPNADLRDGLLEVCMFSNVNWITLARCGPELLLRGTVPASRSVLWRAKTLEFVPVSRTPFEVDGELAGELPAKFSVSESKLRVICPA